jgi:hypothetical protein
MDCTIIFRQLLKYAAYRAALLPSMLLGALSSTRQHVRVPNRSRCAFSFDWLTQRSQTFSFRLIQMRCLKPHCGAVTVNVELVRI